MAGIQDTLFEGNNQFVEDLFAKKEAQINKLFEIDDEEKQNMFKKYAVKALELKKEYGYGDADSEQVPEVPVVGDLEAEKAARKDDEAIDFTLEVEKLMKSLTFRTGETSRLF